MDPVQGHSIEIASELKNVNRICDKWFIVHEHHSVPAQE